jgi:hypothetical protein
MADQRNFDFESNLAGGKLSAERATEAALRLSQGSDPDSKAAAAAAIQEAEQIAIGCADAKTQLNVFEASGDFHVLRGDYGIAKTKYETAMGSAELLKVMSDDGVEDVERLRFKLAKVGNTDHQAFNTLEKTAQPSDSYDQRNMAWTSYQQDKENPVGRLAARGLGSEEDFRRRLDAAKCAPRDDEDEDIRW